MADAKAYRVVLSLDNVLLCPERLQETPSMEQGLDRDVEIDLRIIGCEYIQTGGVMLKLPQVSVAQGPYRMPMVFLGCNGNCPSPFSAILLLQIVY